MDGQLRVFFSVLGAIAALAVTGRSAGQGAAPAAVGFGAPVASRFAPLTPPATLPLAAEGFCVVTLRDQREWLSGLPQFGAHFDGRQYAFASPRERDIFVAAPTVYAPVLSGDCAVTFAETKKRVPGKVQFGIVHGGRIHFFANDEARGRFVADPARYADADLADGGRCIVSRVEYRRDAAGLPETAVLVGGMRRLFAGAYEQRLYLQQPARYDAASTAPPAATASVVTNESAQPGARGWQSALQASIGSSPDGAPSAEASSPESLGKEAPDSPGEEETAIAPEPAMGGYCPVTLKTKGVWVRGRYDDRAEIGGLDFFTAGPTEREAFLADPALYIPALGGDCAVSFVDYGEKVRGSTFHAADFRGRLYLFADAERKEAFRAQPERYASIDLAAGGACVVTLKDGGKSTPGFAEFAVWHEGLLYRFKGPEEKAKFLATPEKYATEANAAAPPQPAAQPSVAQ